jgi:hypothetical protein
VIGGNPLLAKAAVDAIEQWKWVPAAQKTKELVELNFHPLVTGAGCLQAMGATAALDDPLPKVPTAQRQYH